MRADLLWFALFGDRGLRYAVQGQEQRQGQEEGRILAFFDDGLSPSEIGKATKMHQLSVVGVLVKAGRIARKRGPVKRRKR